MISLLLHKPTWVPRGSYPALPVDAVIEHPGAGGAGDRGAKVKLGLAKVRQENTFKTVHIFSIEYFVRLPPGREDWLLPWQELVPEPEREVVFWVVAIELVEADRGHQAGGRGVFSVASAVGAEEHRPRGAARQAAAVLAAAAAPFTPSPVDLNDGESRISRRIVHAYK